MTAVTVLAQAYQQNPQAVGGSLGWSALVSVLPLAVVLVLLGALRLRAQWAALSGLAAALLVAVLGFALPVGTALSAAAHGASFGMFPIMWIVVNALWIFNMTVATGHFDVLRVTAAQSAGLSPDLLAAANSSGGVLGKMLSPQNLTIACAAVKLEGQEGLLLRKVIGWSLGMLVLLSTLIFLQSTPVLGWMLP